MIDEKIVYKKLTGRDLDQMLRAAEIAHIDASARVTTDYEKAVTDSGLHRAHECVRLAKLGLWAEKYGIKAVEQGLENTNSDFCSHTMPNQKICSWCEPFKTALANLPKEQS